MLRHGVSLLAAGHATQHASLAVEAWGASSVAVLATSSIQPLMTLVGRCSISTTGAARTSTSSAAIDTEQSSGASDKGVAEEKRGKGAVAASAASLAANPTAKEVAALLRGVGDRVTRLAALTSLSATSRDLCVTLESLALRQAGVAMPVLATPAQRQRHLSLSAPEPASAAPEPGTLPLRDVSRLGDSVTVTGEPAPRGLDLTYPYMDKISCWPALHPNHIESSYNLMTGIKLFPPQEATYPTFVDFPAAMRMLDHHKSRKRMAHSRRLLKRQDKYQIKTWDHYPAEG